MTTNYPKGNMENLTEKYEEKKEPFRIIPENVSADVARKIVDAWNVGSYIQLETFKKHDELEKGE